MIDRRMTTSSTISAVAKASGVSASTLRLWERHGLLSPAKTARGHRRYALRDVLRIRDIRRLRKVRGFNLAAIQTLIACENGDTSQQDSDAYWLGQRLLTLRRQKQLTLREVRQRTGLAPSFVSSIERGVSQPTVATLKKLTECYGTTVAALTARRTTRGNQVIRAGQYRRLPPLGPGIQVEQLAEGALMMDCQRWTLEPGAASQGSYAHEGEEFIHVLAGRFVITLNGRERHELCAGDSMYFKSALLHAWTTPGPELTVVLWINTPPTF
jgi:DNA-binding transcriptional MerR regulator/quercetin dioxygenase-like cupin family protein